MTKIGKEMKRVYQCRNCSHFKAIDNKGGGINWCGLNKQETLKSRTGCGSHRRADIKNDSQRISGPGRRSKRRSEQKA